MPRLQFLLARGLIFATVIQIVLTCGFCLPLWADDFLPDPLSIQRVEQAYRYPQAGWNIVHIAGKPYDRGMQHGRLLAPEIAAYVRTIATFYEPKSPIVAWKLLRRMTNAMFLRGYSPEQLEEMKGIAEGASAAGARFDGRPLDLTDIVVLNTSNELESLDAALEATEIELESQDSGAKPGKTSLALLSTAQQRWRYGSTRPTGSQHCSAFAAVGPATKDGKIVFGHITMFDLYPGNYFNVWLDVQPSQGRHFVMQTFPGGIHSGMDYSMNDAGMLMSETTLTQAKFEAQGIPLGSRVRTATQYASSIEQATEMLTTKSNGLYTTEWILADLKRNEIGLLTLGTHHHKLYRSSKNEWIADAQGFYWSDNNTKDRSVRLETIPGIESRPSPAAAFAPSKRDTIWLKMYDKFRGKIDADFARLVLTKPELVSAIALDAKYTTTDLAAQWQSWAIFGQPLGGIWRPTVAEIQKFPDIEALLSNPWTVIRADAQAPTTQPESAVTIGDLFDPEGNELPPKPKEYQDPPTVPAWHGTLLPKTDGDIWLTTAFAYYERIVALEKALLQNSKSASLQPEAMNRLALELFYYRSIYELGARAAHDVPLAQTKSNMRDENWYPMAAGKGVLLLHSLRGMIGAKEFDPLMDQFGLAHAGQEVTVAQFISALAAGSKQNLAPFFDRWLNNPGLPRLALRKVDVYQKGQQWISKVVIARNSQGGSLTVPITVETSAGEITQVARLDREQTSIEIVSPTKPVQVFVDKYGLTARSNGSPFTIFTFDGEVEQSLIVYGTLEEEESAREAALVLQQSVRRREHNIKPRIEKDTEVTEEDLKTHHLLLIGRPATNSIVRRFQDLLPVTFGSHSFTIRDTAYAHPKSAVIMATENPLNRRYSMVTIAGLGSAATLRVVSQFEQDALYYTQVMLLPFDREEDGLVATPESLVYQVK
jgi:Phospholipase B